MGNVMAYSGITTKVRAMSAKLLAAEDYDTIAGLGTVTEALDYLKDKTAYAPYVNRMDISLYHRGNVEKILYQSLFDDYSRLFRFAGMKQKTFLKLYWKRYEIDLINYCLRIVFNHYDKPFDLEYKKEFFDRYSQISIDRLITSKNIDELVDNLRDTEYYDALARIKDSGAGTLFDYDLALDLYYFSTMWKKGKRVLKGHEHIFKRLRDEVRPSESTVDLPCEEVLSYASAGHLFDDDPDSLPGSCGRVQEPGRDSDTGTVRNRSGKNVLCGKV